jgi:hypothetical protein
LPTSVDGASETGPILSSFGSIAWMALASVSSSPRCFFSASSEATMPCRIALIVGSFR